MDKPVEPSMVAGKNSLAHQQPITPHVPHAVTPPQELPIFGDLVLDRSMVTVRGPRGDTELSLEEFRACARLVEAGGATVGRAELTASCGIGRQSGPHALDQNVARLRKRLLTHGSKVVILTVYGVGWCLVAATASRGT